MRFSSSFFYHNNKNLINVQAFLQIHCKKAPIASNVMTKYKVHTSESCKTLTQMGGGYFFYTKKTLKCPLGNLYMIMIIILENLPFLKNFLWDLQASSASKCQASRSEPKKINKKFYRSIPIFNCVEAYLLIICNTKSNMTTSLRPTEHLV